MDLSVGRSKCSTTSVCESKEKIKSSLTFQLTMRERELKVFQSSSIKTSSSTGFPLALAAAIFSTISFFAFSI